MSDEQNPMSFNAPEAMQELSAMGNFDVHPCETIFDFEDKSRFTKLDMGTTQKMHLNMLQQQLPNLLATGALANAYTVKFPEGLPHTLTALNQGGFGSMIRVDGKFAGSASFYEMSTQAALMGAFSAMSIASGQYFLTQINSQMQMMNLQLDEILEFLYGDKKAELLSEMTFVRYAYENFKYIMTHDQQRTATLISIQQAKKVAMKDVEFYISDLDSVVSRKAKDFAELEGHIQKAFQIQHSLDLSQQLYIMSTMMEVYYSQNMDQEYLSALEADMLSYIDKCDKRLLGSFSTLKGQITAYKARPMEKVDKSSCEKEVSDQIAALNNGDSMLRQSVINALHSASQPAEYYLTQNGNIYVKKP